MSPARSSPMSHDIDAMIALLPAPGSQPPSSPNQPNARLGTLDDQLSRILDLGPIEETERVLRSSRPDLNGAIQDAVSLTRLVGTLCGVTDAAARIQSGTRIGPSIEDGGARFEVCEELGVGSSAGVYRALDRMFSTPSRNAWATLKVFHSEHDGVRALREAQAMHRIHHESVLVVVDCGRTPDRRPYVVYQHFEGGPLAKWLAREAGAPTRRIVRVIARLARGVQAVHAAGLVHNDVSPRNVLVGTDDAVRLIDFGDAVHPADEADCLGTLGFTPPERRHAARTPPTPSCDIYSLGCLLRWCLDATMNGARHHTGTESTAPARSTDQDLARIIARATATLPSERHQSADSFANDLVAWLEGKPLEWTMPGPQRRALLFARRNPVLLTFGALLLIAAVASQTLLVKNERLSEQSRSQAAALESSRARLAADEAQRKLVTKDLLGVIGGFTSAKQAGMLSEVLTSLWVLEWVHGPTMLKDPTGLRAVWGQRIHLLQNELDSLRNEGYGDTTAACLVRTSLALWLLNDGRLEESLQNARDAEDFWAAHALPADPWREQNLVIMHLAEFRIASQSGDAARAGLATELLRRSVNAAGADRVPAAIREDVCRVLECP